MTMLRVRALDEMTDVSRGEERVVGDGPEVRGLIEHGRYELVEEIADDKPAKAKPATDAVAAP